jgi:hypothetical protein
MLFISFKMQIKSHIFSFILMDSFTILLLRIYQYFNSTLGGNFVVRVLRILKILLYFINLSSFCCIDVIICCNVLLPSTLFKNRMNTWGLNFLTYEYAHIGIIICVDWGPTMFICNVAICNQREMNGTRFKFSVHICVRH